jgi:xylulokinase
MEGDRVLRKYLLAHDLGTTGNKATLFTTEGEFVDSITYEYKTNFYNGNWAEQNPIDWFLAVCSTNQSLLLGKDKKDVVAIAFSGQMQGCVCVNKKGELLRNAIIWADQRSTKEEEYIRNKIDEKEFYHITGHKISPSYSIEKLMWIKNNEPDIYKKIYKMLLPKDYIIYLLTGNFVTDYSDASGTNGFDIINLKWSDKIIDVAGIDREMFPDVYPSTYIAGNILSSISEECGLHSDTLVIIGGGDGVCASVGAGSVKENSVYNYIGSSAWVSYTSKKPMYDDNMRTFNWVHMVPGFYAPMGTMQAAGNSFNYVINTICDGLSMKANEKKCSIYDIINKEISNSKIGSNGLIYLPYLLGERSPRWNPNARGALIGLKMEHTKGDILRATVEGILMNLNIILNIFKREGDFTSIHVMGGLVQSPVITGILADIYGIPVHKMTYLKEATSMGAAIAAGVGSGYLKDFNEIHKFNQVKEMVEPRYENYRQYEKVKEIFDKSYYALFDIYEQLTSI